MRTIWKYPLDMRGWNRVPIGPDAKVVLAAIDPASGAPAIWVDLDPDTDRGERQFAVIGTGHDIEPGAKHVGSMIDRSFVWHIFERGA